MAYLTRDSDGTIIESDHPIPRPGCSPTCAPKFQQHCGGACCDHLHKNADSEVDGASTSGLPDRVGAATRS